MDETSKDQHQLRRVGRPRKVTSVEDFTSPLNGESRTLEPDITAKAQEYANRVMEGQSHSMSQVDRVKRVKLALEGQNLPWAGVKVNGVIL